MNEIILGTDTTALVGTILAIIGIFTKMIYSQKGKTVKATDESKKYQELVEKQLKLFDYIQKAISDGKITKEELANITAMGLVMIGSVRK